MSTQSNQAVFAIVLAAGAASRYGATKQLAEYRGVALVRHAVTLASAVCDQRTALVVGHDWRAVYAASLPLDGFLIVNEHFSDGLGSSIALAMQCVGHAADAVIIMLADQPLVTAEHLRNLEDSWSGAENEIVATEFSGTLGPPCLFPRGCFTDLKTLVSDQGGRALFNDKRFRVTEVPFEPARVDIDRPADLDAIN